MRIKYLQMHRVISHSIAKFQKIGVLYLQMQQIGWSKCYNSLILTICKSEQPSEYLQKHNQTQIAN